MFLIYPAGEPGMSGVAPVVFLVEDDDGYRESLRFYFDTAHVDVEEYRSATEFLERYDAGRPGCLVLDVRMPDMSGLELQERLAGEGVQIPIIFISGHANVRMSVRAMKGGAMDFMEKPLDGELLLRRVRKAFERDRVQRAHALQLARVDVLCDRLTPREREVMSLMLRGLSNKEIALELSLSHRTVEVHRARIMTKMECRSLPDLMSLAAECGMLERPDDAPQTGRG